MTYSDYTIQNVLILFGAIQGFTLCFFLYKNKQRNSLAYSFFILFLFSLAYFNLWYGLYFMEIYYIGTIPIVGFPYPYDYLIATGFYFYIKSHIVKQGKKPFYKKQSYLFIPAILYGFFQLYCYFIVIKDGDSTIIRKIEASGFYTINEFVRLAFNLGLGFSAIVFLRKIRIKHEFRSKASKNLNWLFLFSKVFIGYTLLSIILTGITFLFGKVNINSFYLTFLTNTVFIYWIGYLGYTKSNLFFFEHILNIETHQNEKQQYIEQKLSHYINEEEKFKDHDISLTKLAILLEISGKELSEHINIIHKMNFSEYINTYRVRKVKTLLDSSKLKHYTLEAISSEAGFSSKSSFNTIFKKITGCTPSQYKKRQNQ